MEEGDYPQKEDSTKLMSDLDAEMEANISSFEALEREFQEVLSELMGDQGLETFRLEYEKLHRALKKSHEQEKRLVKKCRELSTEILNNQVCFNLILRQNLRFHCFVGENQNGFTIITGRSEDYHSSPERDGEDMEDGLRLSREGKPSKRKHYVTQRRIGDFEQAG